MDLKVILMVSDFGYRQNIRCWGRGGGICARCAGALLRFISSQSFLGVWFRNWEGMSLVDRWIRVSKKILDQLKGLEKHKERDRLELVSSMRVALGGLEMSLRGWKQWVNNPNIMTRFEQEDLEKMNEKLVKFTRSFIEYDLEATELGMKRGLKARKKAKEKKKEKPEAYVT